jgi:hypothetical protein
MGPAAALLELNQDFPGEEDIRAAWAVLGESEAAVFADKIPAEPAFAAARLLGRGEFTRLAAESECFMRF